MVKNYTMSEFDVLITHATVRINKLFVFTFVNFQDQLEQYPLIY